MIATDLTGNIGNHLWQYAVCRTIAEDIGLEWGVNPVPYGDYFQGKSQMDFMNIDYGWEIQGIEREYMEKIIQIHDRDLVNIQQFDEDIRGNIKDNSKMVGCWQSEKYIKHNKENIRKWFEVKEKYDVGDVLNDNVCVINIRGGEYKGVPTLLLGKEYFTNAMCHIKKMNEDINFIVITDDIPYAQELLNLPTYHFSIGKDYHIINHAKWLIISNSSFAYFPTWLNEKCNMVIAPKYWARHNVSNSYWANGDIQTEGWNYLSRENELFTYEECI